MFLVKTTLPLGMFAVPLRTFSLFSIARFLVDVLPNIPVNDVLLDTLTLLLSPNVG